MLSCNIGNYLIKRQSKRYNNANNNLINPSFQLNSQHIGFSGYA